MHVVNNVLAISLLVSSSLSLIASIIAWKRSVPGAFALSLLLLAMSVWAGSYGLYWVLGSLFMKNALTYIAYVGVVSVPMLFLVFALKFSNQGGRLSSRLMVLLSIEPVITLGLLFTNQFHGFMFQVGSTLSSTPLLEYTRGGWYYVNLIYAYLIISAGLILLLYAMFRASPLLRNQYLMVLLASMIPWGSSIYSEYVGIANHVDWSPIMFGLSSLLLTYSIVRNRFMDIIPVARSRIVESMSDGILVLDKQNRVVDINPAMEQILGGKTSSFLGKSVTRAMNAWVDQANMILTGEKTRIELRLPNSPSRYLDLRITPLQDIRGNINGRLMVFRDVTDRKQVEKKLRLANDRLQTQLIEIGVLQSRLRAQAIRDPLTNLFNRRYLDETLDRELERAAREKYPVCVIMVDIDHFKQVNDTYGHEAGDLVLKSLADSLATHCRRGDFACRFGGEEFVVVMPNIVLNIAYQRAETLRQTLNNISVPYGKFVLTATTSMGIACYPTHGEERESILRAADQAMYAAKEAGRNHILTYDHLRDSVVRNR